MALWGLTDTLAGAPKWLTKTESFDGTAAFVAAGDTDTITIPAHGIVDLDQVTLVNGADADVATAGLYHASVAGDVIKLYDTRANAITSGDTGRVDLTVQGTGHSIQVTPSDVYLIDSTEATLKANQDKGLDSPGWYKYSTYNTSDAVTRHNTEQLVAFGEGTVAVTGDTGVDGTDDAVAFDRELTITSISAPAVDLANDVDIVATVVVAQSGVAGGTITFQWQKSTDNGANFTNISADATYTNVTTAVLTVTGSAVSDKVGEQYRCVVSLELALTRTSLPVIATQS